MSKKEPGNWFPINTSEEELLSRYKSTLAPGKEIKTILAVDPGLVNMAVCFVHYVGGKTSVIRTTKFEMPKFHSTFHKVKYLQHMICYWVRPIINEHMAPLDIIIKESIAHGYPGGVADAGRVQHMLESLAWDFNIPFLDVSPTAMRSYFKSKSKSDTKLSVYKKYHVEFPSEDECDVFAIAMTGLAILSGEYKLKNRK